MGGFPWGFQDSQDNPESQNPRALLLLPLSPSSWAGLGVPVCREGAKLLALLTSERTQSSGIWAGQLDFSQNGLKSYKTSIPGGTALLTPWCTQGCLVLCPTMLSCLLSVSSVTLSFTFPAPCFSPWMIYPHQRGEFPELQGALDDGDGPIISPSARGLSCSRGHGQAVTNRSSQTSKQALLASIRNPLPPRFCNIHFRGFHGFWAGEALLDKVWGG